MTLATTESNVKKFKITKSFFEHDITPENTYASVLIRKVKTLKKVRGSGKNIMRSETTTDSDVLNHIYDVDVEQFEKDYTLIGETGTKKIFSKVAE